MPDPQYLHGFGNHFQSEALPGALPVGQNSPQRCPYGLYAEQLSGSAFTAPGHTNRRAWLYRIRPSVLHAKRPLRSETRLVGDGSLPRRRRRSRAVSLGRVSHSPDAGTFVEEMRTIATAGDCASRMGMAAHIYLVARSMVDDYFYDADGELLIVPQQGALRFFTEFGRIEASPGEICVIPRGVKFKAELVDGPARGYVCENYGAPFALPNRGAIGANGLANARDFCAPTAAYEDEEKPCRLSVKWGGAFYQCDIDHSPLDVVAWHGNYAPYKYDLQPFLSDGRAAVRSSRPVDLHVS